MAKSYYNQKQIIATCDRKGNITGEIEKWEAHKKGTLHRALTIALTYKGNFILQHRKHPAFDGVYDLTSSSHQLVQNGKLQDTIDCAKITLSREWDINKSEIGKIIHEGAVYYKEGDPKSEFTEHEYCDVLITEIKKLPAPNFDYAYGFSLITKEELLNKKSRIYPLLAPWVIKMIEKKMI